MNGFRTVVEVKKSVYQLDLSSKIMLMGSCFTENIGLKLMRYKFNIQTNPLGILYNPESIAQSIDILLKAKHFTPDDLFEHQGVWHSFYHHSRFSDTNQTTCLEQINGEIERSSLFLKEADFLFITFGTSWVYEWITTKQVVSNCHKLPAKKFRRYRLSVCDMVETYSAIIRHLEKINPDLQVVFTISPVRHLKDGAAENLVSKAALTMAVHELVETFQQVHYFPAYEIMMDDLRDYRFYASDMTHPSDLAIDYIWDKFKTALIDRSTFSFMDELESLTKAMEHRPFQPQSEGHRKFISQQLEKIEKLKQTYPSVDLSKELEYFLDQ